MNSRNDDDVDLANCEREPIHLLGRTQDFGFLIGLTSDWIVSHASANAGRHTGIETGALIGEPARSFLPDEAIHAIRNRLQHLRSGALPEVVHGIRVGKDRSAPWDATVHIAANRIVLEFEPADDAAHNSRHVSDVQQAINRIARIPDLEQSLQYAARFAAALTGYDRVMAYRFAADDSGEVVAEACGPGMEPFLGLRYPASDIPRQARILYLRNPIRIIQDSGGEGHAVLPAAKDPAMQIDLSNAILRSVSPIHLEYLRNMGVAASMSISLIVEGKLWGLIAFHHNKPKALPQQLRNSVLLFGQMLSLLIEGKLSREDTAFQQHANELVHGISRSAAASNDVAEVIFAHAEQLLEAVPADGLAVYATGRLSLTGATPSEEEIRLVARRLNTLPAGEVYATAELRGFISEAEDFRQRGAGLLAIPISKTPRDYVMFFRREVAKSVTWAGNPDKPVTVGRHGARLTPRKSFEAWKSVVEGQSEEWSRAQVKAAEQIRITLLEVVLRLADDAALARKRAAEKQELLIAELNHRVRNLLNLVRSLISQTAANGISTGEFTKMLDRRIQALARAHDQITKDNWSPAPVKQLIRTEAAGYLLGKADRVVIDGKDALLTPAAYSNLALVVHELMTNSAKYGALSDSRGRVDVRLSRRDDGSLDLHWREKNGPPVSAPERRGFGSTIIERSIPFELRGEASVDYHLAGVEARFWVPSLHVRDKDSDEEEVPLQDTASPGVLADMPKNVLLVEDNLIIAVDVEDILRSLGAANVLVCSNVATAADVVDEGGLDFAVLDINLGSELSLAVAERLMDAGVPFIFASGYGETNLIPQALRHVPILSKPYDREGIRRAIAIVTERRTAH